MGQGLRISSRGVHVLPKGGVWRLQAERRWIVQGEPHLLRALRERLPERFVEPLADNILTLFFGNCVGNYQIPSVGQLRVRSGKYGEKDFGQLLERITAEAEALPFTAGDTGALPFERAVLSQDVVLYHAFVYLRHILGPTASRDEALRPPLEAILREPHRRLRRQGRVVPLEAARRVDPRALLDMVSGRRPMARVGARGGPLAARLNGQLPLEVEETIAEDTFDTAENRFVKSFLGLCAAVIDRMRARVREGAGTAAFRARIEADCDGLDRALRPVRHHAMWRSVGTMVHFPAGSSVLQRQRSYRAVFGHYNRLRLGSKLPLNAEKAEALLEVKDIALLYELWSCFALIRAVEAWLGKPVSVARKSVDALQVSVPWEFRATWADGTEVLYNPRFSRSRGGDRASYSVPLRPDLALRVPEGCAGAGLHLLDAKFKVDWLSRAVPQEESEEAEEKLNAEERAGNFKRADLYKMHTYRDAITDARSAWVLYPGTIASFYPETGNIVQDLEALGEVDGVGGVPLPTEGPGEALLTLVRKLLQPRPSGSGS